MAIPTSTFAPSATGVAKKRGRNNNNRRQTVHGCVVVADDTSSVGSSSTDSSLSSSDESSSKNNYRQGAKSRNNNGRSNNSSGKNNRRKNNNKNGRGNKNNRQQQRGRSPQEHQNLDGYVAMDCEMVGVGPDGQESALARVTIVGWDGGVLLDEYVEPSRPVTDYRTFVSGITPQHLEQGAIDLDACRSKVLDVLAGRVLVGHALKNDLTALGILHPWFLVRDTAKYKPFMKTRTCDGLPCPRKLKDLASEQLHRDIQLPGRSHCPIEDAVAAMDLYKSVRESWETVVAYNINKTRQIQLEQQHHQLQQNQPVATAA